MPLDRQWIEARIPHRGRMCLLDEVLEWSADMIRCRASSHRAADNPLRAGGRLGVACGVEYAAQAMAVHGALSQQTAGSVENRPGATATSRTPATGFVAVNADRVPAAGCATVIAGQVPAAGLLAVTADRTPAAGFLAAVRNVEFHTACLDDVRDDLLCEALRIAGDSSSALYDFELRGMGRILLRGRATVVLDAGERLTTP